MSKRDLIIFITLSFMWSLSFVFYRIGVPEFGSLAFASLRVIFAGLVMLAFVMVNKKNRDGLRDIGSCWRWLVFFLRLCRLCCFLFLLSQSTQGCWRCSMPLCQ